MSVERETNHKTDEELEFCWGKKKGRGLNKKVQFYESFEFDGVEYSLYDSVYLYKAGETEPYVGKLLKIWEQSVNFDRKIKVLWFFRPSEIANHLQDVDVLQNELFLGAGEGTGLTNINPLEAIAGKCNVVCISKDSRNRQPSADEVKMADFIFYRTFDVKSLTISDKLDEKIATVDVGMLLNKNNHRPADLSELHNVKDVVDAAKTGISADAKLGDEKVAAGAAKQVLSAEALLADCSAEKRGTVVSDKPVLVAGKVKKENSNKVIQDIDVDVKSDAGMGFGMVKEEDNRSKEARDVAKSNITSVTPTTSKQVLESGQKPSLKSPDIKKTELREVGKGVAVTATENGKSLQVNGVKKQIVAGGNKSQDRLSKKRNPDGSARETTGSGGIRTQKSVNASPASNVIGPAGGAAATDEGDKLNHEAVGISDTIPSKQKRDNPVDEESSDKRKLSRERDNTSEGISKKRKTNGLILHKPNNKVGKVLVEQPNDSQAEAYNEVKEVTQRPVDKSKWFTASSWEDRMKFASDEERLVHLQNLDPTYNSTEVENIVWHGFGESCNVKIVQHTAISSPHSGQAFAIFNKREAAQKVVTKLHRECLMLPNGRPLVGITYKMSLPGNRSQYHGHLSIEKLKHQMQKEMRDAVSTSHSVQANTIEYEMALEWRLLQDRSDLCWKLLYQKQGEEVKNLTARLKSK